MVTLVILCLHDSGIEKDHRKVVADYHALTKVEIGELLEMAKELNPVMESERVSQIKRRLTQGIMEMTCPPPVDGHVARRAFLMGKLFTSRRTDGVTPDLVNAFDLLLNWHE